jgi:hypothetical protein
LAPQTKAPFNWKKMGKEDVKGAISAGVSGLGLTLIGCGLVGWKGWGALILGNAVVCSAADAIEQLWPDEQVVSCITRF